MCESISLAYGIGGRKGDLWILLSGLRGSFSESLSLLSNHASRSRVPMTIDWKEIEVAIYGSSVLVFFYSKGGK